MNCQALRLLLTVPFLAGAIHSGATETGPARKAEDSLTRLGEGNQRFMAGTATRADHSAARRAQVALGQAPFAVIVTCADSRLSPEIVFDEGLGELFVIRNAGNLLDNHVYASIEYAVEHLHTPLVVVLGHSRCGAVTAAVAGGELPGHLPAIAESLAPAVAMAKRKPGDAVENAVRINAKLSAAALAGLQPILAEAVKAGQVKVVAARYDIATGQVEFLD